jgi:hypothetical protein
MQYSEERFHLRVEFDTRQCHIPTDELVRMQNSLVPLGEAVKDFADSDLGVTVIHHPNSAAYHVEARLKLPGRTLFAGERDAYLDSAFQRCLAGLLREVETYRRGANGKAGDVARRRAALERDIVAPESPDMGALGRAVSAGDYGAFRTTLSGYEEWLRKRVGRWIQRYPEAQARLGHGLALGDLVEEVFLNAFENYPRRPREVRLHDWLDSLLDPSLKALLRKPGTEKENISFARTLRETPLGPK